MSTSFMPGFNNAFKVRFTSARSMNTVTDAVFSSCILNTRVVITMHVANSAAAISYLTYLLFCTDFYLKKPHLLLPQSTSLSLCLHSPQSAFTFSMCDFINMSQFRAIASMTLWHGSNSTFFSPLFTPQGFN